VPLHSREENSYTGSVVAVIWAGGCWGAQPVSKKSISPRRTNRRVNAYLPLYLIIFQFHHTTFVKKKG